jgi:hypothetical protein
MRAYIWILVAVALTAACGAAAVHMSGGHTTPPPPVSPVGTITGTFQRGPASGSGRGVAGIRIGLYTRPIVFGPVMADPPLPVRVTVTGAGGSFRFDGLTGRRYFVSPLQPGGYGPGRWARPGGAAVVIRVCTTCAMPL